MIFTYITFAFFALLIIYALIKKYWKVSVYLIAVYAFSAFFSILIANKYSDIKALFPDNVLGMVIPTIIYCGLLTITFMSYFKTSPDIEGFSNADHQKRFEIIGFFISSVLIVGIVLVLPKLRFSFNYGVGNLRNDLAHGNVEFNETGKTAIGSTILLYFGNLCYPLILMFFYSLIHIKGKMILKIMLLVASFSEVILGVFVGGRTNIIYYALFFIFALIVFFRYMPQKAKTITLVLTAVVGIVIAGYVINVSAGRFSARSQGINYYYETYAGQSYVYFCNFINNDHWHPYSLVRILPILSYLILGRIEIDDYRALITQHTGLDIGCFYTFMGDLFVDIGLIGLIIYVLLFRRIASKVAHGNVFDISKLLYVGMTFTIPLFGVFYYYPWQKYVTLCFVLTILLGKYISGDIRFEGRKIILKKNRY